MKSDGSVFTLENEELLIMVERHGSQLSSFTYPFSIYCQICKWKIPL